MAFKKSFPRRSRGTYPEWVDIILSDDEETSAEARARQENARIMAECLRDARKIIQEEGLIQADIAAIACALFEKRASHSVYWKENLARDKFQSMQGS